MLPALLAMAWLLAGLPLLLLGWFTPALMLVVSVPVAVVLLVASACAGSPAGRRRRCRSGPEQARTPWWAVSPWSRWRSRSASTR